MLEELEEDKEPDDDGSDEDDEEHDEDEQQHCARLCDIQRRESQAPARLGTHTVGDGTSSPLASL